MRYVMALMLITITAAGVFGEDVRITATLPESGTVTIIDSQGHMVDKARLSGGSYTVTWGGLNRIGRPVDAGTYHVEVTAGEHSRSHTLTFDGHPTGQLALHPRRDIPAGGESEVRGPTLTVDGENGGEDKETAKGREGPAARGDATVAGRITTFGRREPLQGATVVVRDHDGHLHTARTGPDGRYRLKLPAKSDTAAWRLAVKKQGYAPYRTWVTLAPEQTAQRTDVRLMTPAVHHLALNDVFAAGPNPGRPLMRPPPKPQQRASPR